MIEIKKIEIGSITEIGDSKLFRFSNGKIAFDEPDEIIKDTSPDDEVYLISATFNDIRISFFKINNIYFGLHEDVRYSDSCKPSGDVEFCEILYKSKRTYMCIKYKEGKYFGVLSVSPNEVKVIIPADKKLDDIYYENGYFYAQSKGKYVIFGFNGVQVYKSDVKVVKVKDYPIYFSSDEVFVYVYMSNKGRDVGVIDNLNYSSLRHMCKETKISVPEKIAAVETVEGTSNCKFIKVYGESRNYYYALENDGSFKMIFSTFKGATYDFFYCGKFVVSDKSDGVTSIRKIFFYFDDRRGEYKIRFRALECKSKIEIMIDCKEFILYKVDGSKLYSLTPLAYEPIFNELYFDDKVKDFKLIKGLEHLGKEHEHEHLLIALNSDGEPYRAISYNSDVDDVTIMGIDEVYRDENGKSYVIKTDDNIFIGISENDTLIFALQGRSFEKKKLSFSESGEVKDAFMVELENGVWQVILDE